MAREVVFFFFQAEDGIRDYKVTGVRRVLFRSSLMPDSSEKPSAMALDESGTEKTQSVPAAGCSRASSRPSARRTPSTERWKTVLSGREKYTSSNTQRRWGFAGSAGRSSSSAP